MGQSINQSINQSQFLHDVIYDIIAGRWQHQMSCTTNSQQVVQQIEVMDYGL